MKRVLTALGILITCWLLLGAMAGAGTGAPGDSHRPVFTMNMGQWPDNVLGRATTAGATVWIASDGVYYQFSRRVEAPGTTLDTRVGQRMSSVEQAVIMARFSGANPTPGVELGGVSGSVSNYFVGNDRSRWRTHVPSYETVTLRDIYPGVDIRFSSDEQGGATYQFLAADGVDLSAIRIDYDGGTGDDVSATTTVWNNTVELISAPRSAEELTARHALLTADRSNGTRNTPQPVAAGLTVSFSTYLGGSSSEAGWDVATDAAGNVYVTGETGSADFPLHDPYQPSPGEGNTDAFLTKFSPDGTLLFSTYLVGEDLDRAFRVVVDAQGRPHLAGYTSSYDFPTVNSIQPMHGFIDAFVMRLSPGGDSLVFSTCLGGQRVDECWGLAVGADGCTYVVGQTNSLDFPTENPLMGRQGPLDQDDAFVAKLSADGGSLIYSTYLGGTRGDVAEGIAVDGQGCAYVTGGTLSSDFPLLNPYQATRGGYCDMFVTKLSAAGNALVYSTFLGGNDTEWPVGIGVDASGNACVAGETQSPDYPTLYPYQTHQGLFRDVCITKLAATGASLIHSTCIGGTMDEWPYGFSMDTHGNAYVIGHTVSQDFPTTNAFQEFQGQTDCFVAMMPASGYQLIFGTYLGGSDIDHGYAVTADEDGNVWVTGRTYSTDFPTVNAFQSENHLGYDDAFLTRFDALDASCCLCSSRGNMDDSPDCLITMGDLTVLIDNLFIALSPLSCPEAANVDLSSDGLITMGDLTVLIDNLFILLTPLPACPGK